jgi:selenium donor protein
MTHYAYGGCVCKIPPGELEAVVAGHVGGQPAGSPNEMIIGLDDRDDAAVVRIDGDRALGGGHSIDDPEPEVGLAVTGLAAPGRLLRIDTGRAGVPLTLTKPLGIGVLRSRHKATGERFEQALAAMTTLNRNASAAALAADIECATDITGFGLLGHAYKLARASVLTARTDSAAVSYLDGARGAAEASYVSGGTRRNLDWGEPAHKLVPRR